MDITVLVPWGYCCSQIRTIGPNIQKNDLIANFSLTLYPFVCIGICSNMLVGLVLIVEGINVSDVLAEKRYIKLLGLLLSL